MINGNATYSYNDLKEQVLSKSSNFKVNAEIILYLARDFGHD
jgi:hypothetical protein